MNVDESFAGVDLALLCHTRESGEGGGVETPAMDVLEKRGQARFTLQLHSLNPNTLRENVEEKNLSVSVSDKGWGEKNRVFHLGLGS